MHIRVLGPLEVLRDGAPVPLGSRKQRTALALLAAEAGKAVSVEALIDALWGDEPTSGARSTLQTHISNLRHELEAVIVHENGAYRLDVEPGQVDAVQFEEEVTRTRDSGEADPAEASQRLRSVLALWRGPPYADLEPSFALEVEANRLEELRLEGLEMRIEAELAMGYHGQLATELDALCSEYPDRERFRAQHMLALYRSGRQGAALRAFQTTRMYLTEELGLEPSRELRELERRILNHDPSLDLDVEPLEVDYEALLSRWQRLRDSTGRATTADPAGRRARRRWIIPGLASLAATATLAATLVVMQDQQATDDARITEALQLATWARASLDVDPERSILLGLEAAETTRAHDGTVLPEAEHVLRDALSRLRTVVAVPNAGFDLDRAAPVAMERLVARAVGFDVGMSPDGARFVIDDKAVTWEDRARFDGGASATVDGAPTATVYDARTGAALLRLRGHVGSVESVEYSPNGRHIATAAQDRTTRIWDAATGAAVRTFPGAADRVRFDLEGRRVATVDFAKGTATVWDIETGRRLHTISRLTAKRSHTGFAVAFLPGERLVVARDRDLGSRIVVIDLASGEEVAAVEDAHPTYDLDVSSDGRLVAAAHPDRATIFRLPGLDVFDSVGQTGFYDRLFPNGQDITFSQDGTRLAAIGKVWEVTTSGVRDLLTPQREQELYEFSFSADGSRLVNAEGPLRGARVWDLSGAGRGEVLSVPGPDGDAPGDVELTSDGKWLVAPAAPEGAVRVWNIPTARLEWTLGSRDRWRARDVVDVAVSADDMLAAIASRDGTARVYALRTSARYRSPPYDGGAALSTVRGCKPDQRGRFCAVVGVAFSPDGSRLATLGADARLRVFDTTDGRLVRKMVVADRAHDAGRLDAPEPVAWSSDGTRVLVHSRSAVSVWDVQSGRVLQRFRHELGSGPAQAAWSPNGSLVLLGGRSGLSIRDAESGREVGQVATGHPVRGIAFGRGGTRLAIEAGGPVVVREWRDNRVGDEIARVPGGSLRTFALSPDGALLAVLDRDPRGGQRVRVHALDVNRLIEAARGRVTRSLTDEECSKYLRRACSHDG
ncbi:MAG: winged helix-turn-helix domain-containing protein [Thermoleophilia bacterium]|nr:winged helix-turn-helix domain-containing protein [Thermoleophilia bacterium]